MKLFRDSLLCLSVCVMALTGCQSTQKNDETNQEKTTVQKSASDIFIQHLKTEGDDLLCRQPAYLSCFRITPTKCQIDLAPYKKACVEKAIAQNGNQVTEQNYKAISNAFSLCMLVSHAVKYPKRAEAIGRCLDNARFENKPKL